MNGLRDYRDYCFRSDWDGNGEIYDIEKQTVIWKFQSKNLRSESSVAKLSRRPVFAMRDASGLDVLAIYREKRLPLGCFRIVENARTIGSIFQRSIFFTRYEFEFSAGDKWKLYLPMFSVRGRGQSEAGDKLLFQARSRKQWFIRLSAGADKTPLLGTLAFITRKKLQCT